MAIEGLFKIGPGFVFERHPDSINLGLRLTDIKHLWTVPYSSKSGNPACLIGFFLNDNYFMLGENQQLSAADGMQLVAELQKALSKEKNRILIKGKRDRDKGRVHVEEMALELSEEGGQLKLLYLDSCYKLSYECREKEKLYLTIKFTPD